MSIGLVLALTSAVAYGAADFVGGVGSRRHSSWQVVLVGQTAGALVMLVAGTVAPGSPGIADFAWALLAGTGSATGSIFLFRGLSRGRMGLVAPVSAVAAAILPVVVGIALGERPTWHIWIGVLIALPGIWLVSRETTARPGGSRAALLDGAIAGAGFGILFIALAQVPAEAGLLPLAANQLFGGLVTIAAASALRQPWRPGRGVLTWGSASGLLGALGTLTFMLATGAIQLGVAAVLASLYPAVTVLLAAAILKERIDKWQRLGLAVCTVAVATLALS
ncbi:multidrug transporter [Rhizocola hellebori]|uniref:Multidrug transporter n=1 Tax=Rhizocola hellebori TaxID=1392758 RepID=A0A8J3Q398_9ACTN|nr:DMT family transporter [Rhizocola hellebori]GIH02672.1 multidrug transporter [Rhizocola hellebori]